MTGKEGERNSRRERRRKTDTQRESMTRIDRKKQPQAHTQADTQIDTQTDTQTDTKSRDAHKKTETQVGFWSNRQTGSVKATQTDR